MAKDLQTIIQLPEDELKKDALVAEFLKEYKDARNEDFKTDKAVGNNGYTVGQIFNLTGVVKVAKVTNAEGVATAAYLALETAEGVNLSLQSVMGLSSLKGYKETGSYPNEYHLQSKPNEKLQDDVVAEVTEDFNFADAYKPVTRELLKFAVYAKENGIFAGHQIKFLGTVVRPFVAKKDGKDISDATKFIKKGYNRAQTAKLWQVL